MRYVVGSVIAVLALGACGGDSGESVAPTVSLDDEAQAGYEIFRKNGCAGCHGADGEGGVGPALRGLFGSDVPLQDGRTVVADEAYLTLSIKDPGADKVEGYNIPMPRNDLSDAEVASVVAFLRQLGDESAVPGL